MTAQACKMTDERPQVELPGKLFRRGTRWWWKVRLPGEKGQRSRALKPEGATCATTDKRTAAEIALCIWQEAIRTDAQARLKAEHAAETRQLRTQFQEKIKALEELIESAEARARSETETEARFEAELNDLTQQAAPLATCECCQNEVPKCELQWIDSGQRLCEACLAVLRAEAREKQMSGRPTPMPRPYRQEPNHGSHVLHAEGSRREALHD